MALWWSGSQKGAERGENQDSCGQNPEQGLFVLSDGMGGHAQGGMASRRVVEAMLAPDSPDETRGLTRWLDLTRRMQRAHESVLNLAQSLGEQGNMGATAVCVWLNLGSYFIGSVGDSRGYLLRNGKLSQVTEDHTLMRQYQSKGVLTPEEALVHPMRHVLVQAMGVEEIKPDVFQGELKKSDRFLLTSDGVHGVLDKEKIKDILSKASTPEYGGKKMLDEVRRQKGADDATVVLVFADGEV